MLFRCSYVNIRSAILENSKGPGERSQPDGSSLSLESGNKVTASFEFPQEEGGGGWVWCHTLRIM